MMLHESGGNTAAIFRILIWQIWKERNAMVWDNSCKTPVEAVCASVLVLREWLLAKFPMSEAGVGSTARQHDCKVWHPPPTNVHKINVDAGVFADLRKIGVGMVQRDSNGEFLCAKVMSKVSCEEAELGEAWGFL